MDLRGGSERPRGELRGADGSTRPFTGWLGLLSAVQAALDSTKGASHESKEA